MKTFWVAECVKYAKGCFLDEESWTIRDLSRAKRFNSRMECADWISTLSDGCRSMFEPSEFTEKDLLNCNKAWYEKV